MSTENPVVIITGANNGIGFHMAAALLEERYRVAARWQKEKRTQHIGGKHNGLQ